MRSNKYLWDICMEIYRQMYKEAVPSADFDKMLASGETSKPDWFMKHYLPMKRQEEIFDSVVKKYHCDEWDKKHISTEIWLGGAPSGYKKDNK